VPDDDAQLVDHRFCPLPTCWAPATARVDSGSRSASRRSCSIPATGPTYRLNRIPDKALVQFLNLGGPDLIRQSLLLLLSTYPGERVMRPDFGCELLTLAFARNDDTTAGLAIQKLGLQGVDVRLLRTQRTPGRRFLLTGAFATGDEPGAGVSRIELYRTQPAAGGFKTVGNNWVGGSCRDLAPVGDRVFAATAKAAISAGDTSREDAPWRPSAVDCGLPLREVGRFQPLLAVAAAGKLLLAGCVGGVYASSDGRNWEHASPREFSERISLPRTWLFAPGEHQLTVRYEDVGERDAG
jgi:hypothetical protein